MMKLVYFGTPGFAVRPYSALISAGYDIAAVVTQPDRQSGRGRRITACPVKTAAEQAGHLVLQPSKVGDGDFISRLRELSPDVVVVAAYGQILPSDILFMPRFGCVNIHASLLPAYRGAAPVNWAIMNGESKTGITTMMMDEGMDTGAILLQKEADITGDDTAESLAVRLSEIGASLIVDTLKGLEAGTVQPVPQRGEYSIAPLLKKADGLLDWSRPAAELARKIRAMHPWPVAYTFLGRERFRILKALPLDGSGKPGVIDEAEGGRMIAGTGEGRLSLVSIQPAGKPAMDIASFLRGRSIERGTTFSSGE